MRLVKCYTIINRTGATTASEVANKLWVSVSTATNRLHKLERLQRLVSYKFGRRRMYV